MDIELSVSFMEVEPTLQVLAEVPAVILTGPRARVKTTTARPSRLFYRWVVGWLLPAEILDG